jgi:hypothetical protein
LPLEDAIGLEGEHLLHRGGRRDHGHAQPERGERAQDIALDSVIERDHMMASAIGLAIAVRVVPAGARPVVALAAGHLGGEVHADQARPGAGEFGEAAPIGNMFGMKTEGRGLSAGVTQSPGQAAGVDAGDADQTLAGEPAVEVVRGAVVGRIGDRRPQNQAARVAGRGFEVLHQLADHFARRA